MKKYLATVLLILLVQIISFAQTETSCPKIWVTEPAVAIMFGADNPFSVSIPQNLDKTDLKFVWSVDRGKIAVGQGTNSIKVSTDGLAETTITATVNISGLPKNCANTFSGSSIISHVPQPLYWDEYGEQSDFDILARLDSFAIEFVSDPKSTALMIENIGSRELIDERESLIAYHLRTEHKLDLSKVIFARNPSESKIRTRIWVDREGTNYRKCEDCEIVKGNNIEFDNDAIELRLMKQSCPSISVSEPAVATAPGENLTFTANVSDSDIRENIGYKWTISSGTIVKGQGTYAITVRPDSAESMVTATVEISGLPDKCEHNSATASSPTICHAHPPILRDEFGVISESEMRNRVEAYSKDLIEDPNATGYLVSYGNAEDVKDREKIIRESLLKFAKIASQRIVFVYGGEEEAIRTRLWILPVGADSSSID